MDGCAGGGRLAGDDSPHHAVLQGGGRVAVVARAVRAPYRVKRRERRFPEWPRQARLLVAL